MREGLIDQFVELGINSIQRGAKWERQHGVVGGEDRGGRRSQMLTDLCQIILKVTSVTLQVSRIDI